MAYENISRWKAPVWVTVLYFVFVVFRNIPCAVTEKYTKDIIHEYTAEIRFNARLPTNGVKQVPKTFNLITNSINGGKTYEFIKH